MMTTKKRRPFQRNLVVVAAAAMLWTACGPPGARQLRQGERDIQDGQYAEAIVVLRDATRILENAPRSVQAKAWNLLGVACHDGGQLEAASASYLQALKLDRGNAAIDYNLGCLRGQQTNWPGAIDYLTTYVALRPRDPKGYLQLGSAYFHYGLERGSQERSRFLEAARYDFDSVLRLTNSLEAADAAMAANALGMLELQRRAPGADSIRAAAQDFAFALHRNPRYAPAMLNFAIVSQQYLNNPRQALKLYLDYLAVTPQPPHAKEVAKLAHDLDLSLRISITPEAPPAPPPSPAPAAAPSHASVPRPAPPPPRALVAPSNPVAAIPKPHPAEPRPAQALVPPRAPPPAQAVAAAPAPPPAQKFHPMPSPPPAQAVVPMSSLPPAQAVVPAPSPQPAQTVVPMSSPPPTQAIVPTPAPPQAQAVASIPAPPPARASAPPVRPQPPLQTTTPSPAHPPAPASSPVVNTTNLAPEPVVTESTPAPRKTIPQRLNPLHWFSTKPKARPEPASEAEPPPVPSGARYEYPPPVTPIPGDRARARRLEAEAFRARKAGDLPQSLRAYQDAIAADATFYDASYGLGLEEMELRDYPAALEALHRAVTLQADSAQARYAFAWTLQKRGYTEDAVHELDTLLAQHPDDARAHLLLGNLYAEKLGQPKQAREHYLRALALDPTNPQAPNIRAWLEQNP